MATTFAFTVSCTEGEVLKADSVLAQAHRLVEAIESDLSEFRPQSKITEFNNATAATIVDMGVHASAVLRRSVTIAEKTSHAFDITFRSTIRGSLGSRIQFLNGGKIKKVDGELKVGLGAIGKGYALDQVRLLLEREGFFDYCLNAGGSSLILNGFALNSNEPWTFAWSTQKDKGIQLQHRTGQPLALGMSGVLEQGEHIARPMTQGVRPILGTFVGASSAMDADAYSTALFVSETAGVEIDTSETVAAAVIDQQKEVAWSEGFEKFFRKPIASAIFFGALIHSSVVRAAEDVAIDLDAMSGDKFNPYLYERSTYWIIPALFILAMTLLHLKKLTPGIEKKLKARKKGEI